MDWQRLREKVLEEVYPTEEELSNIKEKYEEISEFIEKEFGIETHFAGSAGRETCMSGDNDIDIFLLFPEELDSQELEDKGLEIGKKVFSEFNGEYEIEYAEHPYTKGEIDSFEIEIVPCYDTDPEDIKSSVDRTPHHSRWVKKNLNEEQRKDVVILKKFLSTAGIYGSSLKVEGFSGYLCEILIQKYGSFDELVREVVKWNSEKVIDPENHHEDRLPDKLEKKFEREPLKVIDPVDPERNVSSVLSLENYAKFIHLCWRFREDPGIDFFREEKTEYTEFEIKQEIEKRGDFLVLEFENIEEVDDIVYPQMRKTLGRLVQVLKKKDFRIFESGFHVGDKTRIFFELDQELPEVEELKGPKVFHGEDHLTQFSSKYDNSFIQEDRLVAKTEREYINAKEFLKDFLSEDLKAKGIPDRVAGKIEDYSFVEPVREDGEWLNYLGEKLQVQQE